MGYNKFHSIVVQATEKAARQKLEKQQEQEDNLVEIENLLHSDLLTENPKQATSAFGPNHVIVHRWKGMTQDQIDDVIRRQKQQVQERKVSILAVTNSVISCKLPSFCSF